MKKPVMSMFASELDCLRARDKWSQKELARQEAKIAGLTALPTVKESLPVTAEQQAAEIEALMVQLNHARQMEQMDRATIEKQAALLTQCREALEKCASPLANGHDCNLVARNTLIALKAHEND